MFIPQWQMFWSLGNGETNTPKCRPTMACRGRRYAPPLKPAEELVTGFHERFPALFGLPPMPLGFFVPFNLAWIIIWSLCVWGLAARRRAALFPLWFLGIGCIANGVAHPSFSALTGGYFPGLVTSPVVGVLGVLLLRRLLVVTRAVGSSPDIGLLDR